MTPTKRTLLADRVAERLRRDILSGQYSPGEKLSSELELAARFKVNRFTVREAMNKLVQMHLIARRPGRGTVVLDYSEHASVDVIEDLVLSAEGKMNPFVVGNLLETARILSSELAALAGAAGNIVPRLVLNSVRGLVRKYGPLLETLYIAPDSIVEGYEHVVAAVASRDSERARSLVRWIWSFRHQRFVDLLDQFGRNPSSA